MRFETLTKLLLPFVVLITQTVATKASTQSAPVLEQKTRETLTFEGGFLVEKQSVNGNSKYSYKDGYLTSIAHGDGHVSTYHYTKSGRLNYILFSTGEIQKAAYDKSGALVAIENTAGKKTPVR